MDHHNNRISSLQARCLPPSKAKIQFTYCIIMWSITYKTWSILSKTICKKTRSSLSLQININYKYWQRPVIYASYLNSELYANNWIAFSLHFVSFISYFYIGHHWLPHGAPNSYISLTQSDWWIYLRHQLINY